ncbi:hypothetical protein HA466_0069130 [Hirschfeldia incana]|nr:hypothetical protein HA466_0069130 [Hirschfeldia incana]KAJ0258048.1 hypothetical protein HA466_0069130 [Hirschfeldia incana]
MENGSLFPGYLKAAWWPVFFLRGGSIPEVFGNHKPQTRSKAYGCGQAPPQLTPSFRYVQSITLSEEVFKSLSERAHVFHKLAGNKVEEG